MSFDTKTHLTDLQGKYDHYQESVTQHFATTAQLANALTLGEIVTVCNGVDQT